MSITLAAGEVKEITVGMTRLAPPVAKGRIIVTSTPISGVSFAVGRAPTGEVVAGLLTTPATVDLDPGDYLIEWVPLIREGVLYDPPADTYFSIVAGEEKEIVGTYTGRFYGRGTVSVTSTPSGAGFYLMIHTGDIYGDYQTPALIQALASSERGYYYFIRWLSMEGYETPPDTEQFWLGEGETVNIEGIYEPVAPPPPPPPPSPTKATLTVRAQMTIPGLEQYFVFGPYPGAQIYAGYTPKTFELDPGKYVIVCAVRTRYVTDIFINGARIGTDQASFNVVAGQTYGILLVERLRG